MDAKNALSKSHNTAAFHHQAFLNNINTSKKKSPRAAALSPLRYTRRPVNYSPTRSRGQLRSVFSIRGDRADGDPSKVAEPSSLQEVEPAPKVPDIEPASEVAPLVEPASKVASLIETIVQRMEHSPVVRKASPGRPVALCSVQAKVSRASSPICLVAPTSTAEQKCQTERETETDSEKAILKFCTSKEDMVTPSKIRNHFKCKHGEKNISERLLDSYKTSFDDAYREFMQSRHEISERGKREILDASLTKHKKEAKNADEKEDVQVRTSCSKQIQTNSSSDSFSKHPIIQNLSLSGYGPNTQKFLKDDGTSREVLDSLRRQKSDAHTNRYKRHEDTKHSIKIECENFEEMEGPSRCNVDEEKCANKNWRPGDAKRTVRIVREDSEDTDPMCNFDHHGRFKKERPCSNLTQKSRIEWEEFEKHSSCSPSPRVCDYHSPRNFDNELPNADYKHNVRIECEDFESSSLPSPKVSEQSSSLPSPKVTDHCNNEGSHTSNRRHKPGAEADERHRVQKIHQRQITPIESEESENAPRKARDGRHRVRFELEDTDDAKAKPSRKLKSPRIESDSSSRHHPSCHCRECLRRDLKPILKHHDESSKTTCTTHEEVYHQQKKLQRSKLTTCNRFQSSSYVHSAPPTWNCQPEGPRIAPIQSESDFDKNTHRRNEIAEMLYHNYQKYSFDTTSEQIFSQESWRSTEAKRDRVAKKNHFGRHLERGDGLKECGDARVKRGGRRMGGKTSSRSSYTSGFNSHNAKSKSNGKKNERKGIVHNIRDMISTWPHPSDEDDWECRSDEDRFKFPKETKKAVMIMMQESQSPRTPRHKNNTPRPSNSGHSTESSRNQLPCTKNLLCEKGEHAGRCGKQDCSQSSDKQKVWPGAAKRYPLVKNDNSSRSFPKPFQTSFSGGTTPTFPKPTMNGLNGHANGELNGCDIITQNQQKGCWTIGLINSKFRYLTAETFGFKINANGSSLKKKQIWTLEPEQANGGESLIYLRSHLDKYLAVDSFGNVTCESDEKDPGSKFQISVAEDGSGRWAFRNVVRGYFLGSSSDKLTCTAKVPGDAEFWHVHLAARPQVNLRSIGRKRFAHLSENLDEIHVDANIPWGEDTLFTLEFRADEGGKYALHTCNNKYLSLGGKLVDTCNKECLFTAEYHSGQLALRDRNGAYLSPIGSKAVLKTRSNTVTKDELFSLEDSLPQASFVAALNSRYVSVKQGVDVTANQDEISDHETFQLEFDWSTKRWYIRTMQDRYWTLETGGGIQANGDKRSSNALFDLIWQGDGGSVAFRANNGRYVITKRSGHLYATADAIDENCKYFFYLINRPILVLKCEQGFVGYKSSSSPKLECNKATYETIQVERAEKGVIYFKGQSGKYWHCDSEGVTADSDTPEGFYLELREPTRLSLKSVNGSYLTASKNGTFRLGESSFENATQWEY